MAGTLSLRSLQQRAYKRVRASPRPHARARAEHNRAVLSKHFISAFHADLPHARARQSAAVYCVSFVVSMGCSSAASAVGAALASIAGEGTDACTHRTIYLYCVRMRHVLALCLCMGAWAWMRALCVCAGVRVCCPLRVNIFEFPVDSTSKKASNGARPQRSTRAVLTLYRLE